MVLGDILGWFNKNHFNLCDLVKSSKTSLKIKSNHLKFYIEYIPLREVGWSILTYIILFIKLTIKLINSLQKNILALSLNKSYRII